MSGREDGGEPEGPLGEDVIRTPSGTNSQERFQRRLSVIWAEEYEVDIGPHVFPTLKYRLVKDRLVADGTLSPEDILTPRPASDEDLGRVHTRGYLEKIREDRLSQLERAVLEVPFSPALREASVLCAGGSILAGRLALQEGIAVHLGGGFHHAFADHGEGFCLLNDIAIAVAALLADGSIGRASIVDLDVHQGNGTASIFSRDDRVFTLSAHQQWNYPGYKPPSDLDLGLPDGMGDAEYLQVLEKSLSGAVADHGPDLVFYLAGADPYRQDQLGGLALSMEGLRDRDELVFSVARSAGVPVAVALAGGYARREADTVQIHCQTVRAALAWGPIR